MSRYAVGHRQEAKARILAAAGRGFRKCGYGGIGVDGLAKEAEVTSGAFYGHFPSKEAAFKEAVIVGLEELKNGILTLRETLGQAWIEAFVEFYLGARRECDLSESCALQSLTPDVQRADAAVKIAFEALTIDVAGAVADGLPGGTASERLERAWAMLAVLSGGVTLARSVQDAALAKAMADAVAKSAISIGRATGATLN